MGLDHSTDGERPVARVLFVDDEPLVIRSLRRTLTARTTPWELQFAESGQAALSFLDREPFDVIVSDLLMPGMSGAAVLARVQETHPDVARVVLSELSDSRLVSRTVPCAHLALTKPFETPTLVAAISEAVELRSLMVRPSLRAALGATRDAYAAPPAFSAVTHALADEHTHASEVMSALGRDAALSSRLGRLASYAPQETDRPRPRLSSYLARAEPTVLRSFVLLAEMVGSIEHAAPIGAAFSVEAFERHAIGTAHLAARIVGRREDEERAFGAGLLHDLGELLLLARQPDAFTSARARSAESGSDVEEAERAAMGVSHAEAGAWLLGLLGFPSETISAVLAHDDHGAHNAGTGTGAGLAVGRAVYVASALAHDPDASIGAGRHQLSSGRLGRDVSRLDKWRRAARELAAAARA